jgi:hypothetical protein
VEVSEVVPVSESKSGGGGIGVCGLLGVVFVTLKLCGVIDWSWWWVTAPFWGPIAFVVSVLLFAFVWMLAVKYTVRNTR